MTLGSLFSGSGGFELAGAMAGIRPVWNAEIEPFPSKVTALRFPDVVNLGDVTKIKGDEITPVDIITLGFPCQNVSISGKQAGIHKGKQSNLFFQAIRIITEMYDKTKGMYPRYAVTENVPGLMTIHQGDDFRDVLQAFVSIKDLFSTVPKPDKWAHAGCIVGDGYSIAWRVLDAQYYGLAQRRKRVFILADLAAGRAGEILFNPESERWNPEKGRRAWENAARYVEGSFGEGMPAWLSLTLGEKTSEDERVYLIENHPCDSRVTLQNDLIVQTLSARMGTGGGNVPLIFRGKKPYGSV